MAGGEDVCDRRSQQSAIAIFMPSGLVVIEKSQVSLGELSVLSVLLFGLLLLVYVPLFVRSPLHRIEMLRAPPSIARTMLSNPRRMSRCTELASRKTLRLQPE